MDTDDLLENASVNVELENQSNVTISSQGQIPTEETSEIGYVPYSKPETATQRVTQERSMAIKESLQSGQPYMDSDQVIEEPQAIKPAKVSQAQAKKRADVLEIPVQKAVESGRSQHLIGEVCSCLPLMQYKL